MQDRYDDAEARHRAANRTRSWHWAAALGGTDLSVWRLERFKTVTARADAGQLILPEADMGPPSFMAWLRALLAMLIALAVWLIYLLRHRGGVGQERLVAGSQRVVALHGEISTRTRHVLNALAGSAPPIQAVVLLGRVPQSPARIAALWSAVVPGLSLSDVPLLLPMSPRATLRALGDLPRLMSAGLRQAARATTPVGLRDEVAMAFRVFSGAVAARWWAQHGIRCEVIFGITGTGDTTLLERAIQQSGGRSVHAVHGQATGPNFIGISDLAMFRSHHDVRAYARLSTYGACTVQDAFVPEAKRGVAGLLLLSNLAHPMNPGFQRFGLRDEVALMEAVGEAARTLGAPALPLRWKPHPVITKLPIKCRDVLYACAAQYGFEQVASDRPLEQIAQDNRWILTSPSTVALDLLRAGYLSVVIDPQNSVLDTALAGLPGTTCDPQAVAALCRELESQDIYVRACAAAFEKIGPGCALDLRAELE